MNKSIILGIRRFLVRIPRLIWQQEVARSARMGQKSLAFMTPDHHRVRDFVVRELPRIARPISPELISVSLDLKHEQVVSILDELEQRLTFLYRNEMGAVTWAYPVTVDPTPHRISFSSGEQIYAAWGIDAIATPFVQGQLRKDPLTFTIHTCCAHCGKEFNIEMDGELNYTVSELEAKPMVFVPMVDFSRLEDPSIIDAFWRNSVFFWSEEHVKEYRREHRNIRGTFMSLAQSVYLTPITQGAIFGFPRRET
jgi:Alkylmercury lyase